MNCGDFSELIHGYLDKELDLGRGLEMEEHLKNCPACSGAYEEQQALQSLLHKGALRFEAPGSLRRRVRASLREASQVEATRSVWTGPWYRLWAPIGVIALVLILALVYVRPSAEDPVSGQIVAAQHQSLQAGRLTEVASSDQYVVKSWFYRKLGFSAPAVDLAAHEFPLLGGRADSIDNHPVAVVVYHYQQHPVSLFVWPLKGAKSSPEKGLRRQGNNLVHWTQSGLNCWAVSDVPQANLRKFVRLVQDLGYSSDYLPKGTNQFYRY